MVDSGMGVYLLMPVWFVSQPIHDFKHGEFSQSRQRQSAYPFSSENYDRGSEELLTKHIHQTNRPRLMPS